MPSGGKDNLQVGIGLEIPRASFASWNHDAQNQAEALNETSDRCALVGSGRMVVHPEIML
jgi:hypothetical protein